jgi:hypothetical protein
MRMLSKLAPAFALAGVMTITTSAFATEPPLPCPGLPLVWYKMNEASWNGTPGEVINSGSLGAALNGTASCDTLRRPGCTWETPRPPRGLPNTMLSTAGSPDPFFNAAGQRYSKPYCGRSGYFNWGKLTIGLVNGQMTVTNNWRQFVGVQNPVGLNGIDHGVTVAAWINPYHRAPGGYYFTIAGHGSHFKLSTRRGYLTAEWIGTGGVKRTVSSTTTVDTRDGDPVWHHVAFTFATGEVRLYIDGVEVPGYQDAAYQPYVDAMGNPVTPNFFENLVPVAAPFEVGYTTTFMSGTANGQQGDAFRGLIDDVRIYNYALPQLNVKAIASSPNCECVTVETK